MDPPSGILKSNIESFELEQTGPLVYAGFWRRLGAFVIDWVMIVLMAALAGFVIGIVSALIVPGAEAVDVLAGLLGRDNRALLPAPGKLCQAGNLR